MKFYETNFEDYIYSVEKQNIHKELTPIIGKFPKQIEQFDNMIMYGPSGVGKYSQMLAFLKQYSPTKMKYQKSITIENDKKKYTYNISDVHYEVDMALLGCNSKVLWHSIYQNILDIVSLKPCKVGIIVCKNFHLIHSELLDIFYSYIQQFNNPYMAIKIKFILITENIGFIPENILNVCFVLPVRRPSKEVLKQMYQHQITQKSNTQSHTEFIHKISNYKQPRTNHDIINKIDTNAIINLKELQSFSMIDKQDNIPEDIFVIICDNIIEEMKNYEQLDFTHFRDTIYDILVYNLDTAECIFYILSYFVHEKMISKTNTSKILMKTHTFLKYFNNNYRPIYHLETILFYIILKISNYDEQDQSNINNYDQRNSPENSGTFSNRNTKRSIHQKEIQTNGIEISSR